MTRAQQKRIDIWHNILWSRYKGGVFSALHEMNDPAVYDIRFYQMAETAGDRAVLNAVDDSYHTYPYTLLFKGSLDKISFMTRLRALAGYAFKNDADLSVLTGYEKPEVWVQAFILRLRGKKVMFFCDATKFDQPETVIKNMAKRIVFSLANGVFGYGARARDYVFSYGVKAKNWHMRCQAAALPHDYDAAKALDLRIKMAKEANPEAPRYLYVGRLSKEKNLLRLMDAFARVKKERKGAELIVVGGGPQKEELQQKAKDLAFDPDDILVGSKSGQDLFNEYARATSFVLPSTSEPWGLVVNESLHYGCPVIVSDRCGCVPELVMEGETGFSHDAFSVEDLTDRMLEAAKVFSDVEKTAKTCLAHIAEFVPEKAAKQMLDGVEKVLG